MLIWRYHTFSLSLTEPMVALHSTVQSHPALLIRFILSTPALYKFLLYCIETGLQFFCFFSLYSVFSSFSLSSLSSSLSSSCTTCCRRRWRKNDCVYFRDDTESVVIASVSVRTAARVTRCLADVIVHLEFVVSSARTAVLQVGVLSLPSRLHV